MYEPYHQQAAAAAAQTSNSRSNTNNEVDATESVPAAASAGGAANTTLHRQQLQFAQEFWEEQIVAAEQYDSDFKNHPLPLARIKKVMKSDPEVKMISAEAPILFSKACEIFICEITRRAWLHAEENKRRTLQRSDVANAVSRSDQFDFLIDIVPREEPTKPTSKKSSTREDVAPETEAYDDQQQQAYAQYYQQPAGGLPGYPHAIDPQFYQAVSHDQFQQYMQYQQQAAVYQTPPTSTGGAAAAASSTATGTGASPPPHHSSTTSAAPSAGTGSRNGYPQETGASRQN